MVTAHQNIDRVGGLLSLICAIHCAVVPVVVLLAALGVPVAGELGVFEDEAVELGFSLAAVVFVIASVALGWRQPLRRATVIGFGLGLALLLGARLDVGPEWLGHLGVVAGGSLLAWTHRRSFRAEPACCPAGDACEAEPTPAPAALLP